MTAQPSSAQPLSSQPLDTLSAIRERRTVPLPALRPDPVSDELIEAVLAAANWAPTHGRTEPWRFAVFTGEGRLRLADVLAQSLVLFRGQDAPDPSAVEAERQNKLKAPVWIVAAAQTPGESKFPPFEDDWAAAAAIQNLLLAARSLGLGSKWISNAASMHPHTLQSLGFAPDARPLGLLYLGHVTEWPKGERRPISEKVRWFRDGGA